MNLSHNQHIKLISILYYFDFIFTFLLLLYLKPSNSTIGNIIKSLKLEIHRFTFNWVYVFGRIESLTSINSCEAATERHNPPFSDEWRPSLAQPTQCQPPLVSVEVVTFSSDSDSLLFDIPVSTLSMSFLISCSFSFFFPQLFHFFLVSYFVLHNMHTVRFFPAFKLWHFWWILFHRIYK